MDLKGITRLPPLMSVHHYYFQRRSGGGRFYSIPTISRGNDDTDEDDDMELYVIFIN